ncbi:LytTR family DNA-binding domain-containing protein [Mucilaginibacter sp. SG564]|uniref:LytR/AlgR family response regulator transcription factor n=1 Tax=Mucilaginibacter sp. SG564 TaxID=2587022 RepID=UPI001551D180|nr:LytTR family transcriptional regulator DNA-binding domain-containing protein [Mucilaginibacter sp. SG564]NOW96383.1 hypothetical protein [Mucilaginibacter sp. SG564]
MKKETTLGWFKSEGPYPDSLLMALIACAVSIYILWPFPDEPFLKLIRHQWFLHSFSVIFTIAVAQVWLIFCISSWLDGKYRWEERFYHRILGQLLIGWIIPVAVSALISWFWFQHLEADIHSIRYAYNRYMFKAMMDIALILNLIYLASSIGWFLKRRLNAESTEIEVKDVEVKEQEKPSFTDYLYLQIPDGKEEIKVQVSEIAYLFRKEKDTLLRAHNGRAFIFWQSLDKIEKQLDPDYFYRASRSYIISRQAVRSWQRRGRGVFLEVLPQTDEPVKVGRDKALEIVAWIKKEEATINGHAIS